MNWADYQLGVGIISSSSEISGCEAINILDEDISKIWLSEEGIPQWICISLQHVKNVSNVVVRTFGWECWHAYSTNPKEIRLHVSRDGTKFRIWDTFTAKKPKAGQQLFCCEPINISLYPFIAIEIMSTFGGPQTYLNRIFLYSDEVNNSFMQSTEDEGYQEDISDDSLSWAQSSAVPDGSEKNVLNHVRDLDLPGEDEKLSETDLIAAQLEKALGLTDDVSVSSMDESLKETVVEKSADKPFELRKSDPIVFPVYNEKNLQGQSSTLNDIGLLAISSAALHSATPLKPLPVDSLQEIIQNSQLRQSSGSLQLPPPAPQSIDSEKISQPKATASKEISGIGTNTSIQFTNSLTSFPSIPTGPISLTKREDFENKEWFEKRLKEYTEQILSTINQRLPMMQQYIAQDISYHQQHEDKRNESLMSLSSPMYQSRGNNNFSNHTKDEEGETYKLSSTTIDPSTQLSMTKDSLSYNNLAQSNNDVIPSTKPVTMKTDEVQTEPEKVSVSIQVEEEEKSGGIVYQSQVKGEEFKKEHGKSPERMKNVAFKPQESNDESKLHRETIERESDEDEDEEHDYFQKKPQTKIHSILSHLQKSAQSKKSSMDTLDTSRDEYEALNWIIENQKKKGKQIFAESFEDFEGLIGNDDDDEEENEEKYNLEDFRKKGKMNRKAKFTKGKHPEDDLDEEDDDNEEVEEEEESESGFDEKALKMKLRKAQNLKTNSSSYSRKPLTAARARIVSAGEKLKQKEKWYDEQIDRYLKDTRKFYHKEDEEEQQKPKQIRESKEEADLLPPKYRNSSSLEFTALRDRQKQPQQQQSQQESYVSISSLDELSKQRNLLLEKEKLIQHHPRYQAQVPMTNSGLHDYDNNGQSSSFANPFFPEFTGGNHKVSSSLPPPPPPPPSSFRPDSRSNNLPSGYLPPPAHTFKFPASVSSGFNQDRPPASDYYPPYDYEDLRDRSQFRHQSSSSFSSHKNPVSTLLSTNLPPPDRFNRFFTEKPSTNNENYSNRNPSDRVQQILQRIKEEQNQQDHFGQQQDQYSKDMSATIQEQILQQSIMNSVKNQAIQTLLQNSSKDLLKGSIVEKKNNHSKSPNRDNDHHHHHKKNVKSHRKSKSPSRHGYHHHHRHQTSSSSSSNSSGSDTEKNDDHLEDKEEFDELVKSLYQKVMQKTIKEAQLKMLQEGKK